MRSEVSWIGELTFLGRSSSNHLVVMEP
ncbi:MAG: osmotically inducible protein OsmC, partial [Thermoproteota archaeon]